MKGDVSEIYLFCFTRMMKNKGVEVPKECEVNELSDYQMERLDQFKKWIFDSRGGKESNPVINALQEVFLSNL